MFAPRTIRTLAKRCSTLQPGPGAKIIGATGRYVMPGGIDPHTHLEAAMFDTVSCDDFAR